jgi:predicted GNAT family N-acyltransferase
MTVTVRRVDPGEGLSDAFAVRRAVFIEEQGVSEDEEMDGRDDEASHVVAYDGDRPVGTARLRTVEAGVGKVERVAVRAADRGEGIGRALMAEVESLAADRGVEALKLHAQTRVEGFYEKLDYETTSGVFQEAGIDHVAMVKELDR